MICRKCGHMWFIEEIPMPRILKCPNCGETIDMELPIQSTHQPRPSMDPDVITDIIIENCFHLKNSRGQVLYDYSEKTLSYLKEIGYRESRKEDHVLFLKGAKD